MWASWIQRVTFWCQFSDVRRGDGGGQPSTTQHFSGARQRIRHHGWIQAQIQLTRFATDELLKGQCFRKWNTLSGSSAATAATNSVRLRIGDHATKWTDIWRLWERRSKFNQTVLHFSDYYSTFLKKWGSISCTLARPNKYRRTLQRGSWAVLSSQWWITDFPAQQANWISEETAFQNFDEQLSLHDSTFDGGQSDSLDNIRPSIDFDLVSETSKLLGSALSAPTTQQVTKEEFMKEPTQQQILLQNDPRLKIKEEFMTEPNEQHPQLFLQTDPRLKVR